MRRLIDHDKLMVPVVNINGTSRDELVRVRLDAALAILDALHMLRKLRPHGRDYPGTPDTYQRDLSIYEDRFDSLHQIMNEIDDEAEQIQGDTI